MPSTESLQLWRKPTQKFLEVRGKGSVPLPAHPTETNWAGLRAAPRHNQTVPVVITSPQKQTCIVRNSQSILNTFPDLHSKTWSTQCCQVLGESSWSPSNKYFSDPSSFSFPQRHHTSLKFSNFFKVRNSLKHTVRFCHTLKTTCPRALPSEYLNNNRSLMNQMKETKKWTSKSCSQSQGKHIFRAWKQEREYRVPSWGLQQNYIYQTPHHCQHHTLPQLWSNPLKHTCVQADFASPQNTIRCKKA